MSNELVNYDSKFYPQIRAVLGCEQAPDTVLDTAISYCQAAGLDIMRKPVAIISYGGKSQIVFTIQAITTIASRAGWAGSDEIQYGPMIKHGQNDVPEWGSQTVYKMIVGQRCAFTGPKVYFRERAQSNQNWTKQPMAMFNKCILAAALRTAFPEALAHAMEADEVYQPQVQVDNTGVEALKQTPAQIVHELKEIKVTIDNAEPTDANKKIEKYVTNQPILETEEVPLDDLAQMKDAMEKAISEEELKSIADAVKAYGEMPDDKRKELLAVFNRRRKELKNG